GGVELLAEDAGQGAGGAVQVALHRPAAGQAGGADAGRAVPARQQVGAAAVLAARLALGRAALVQVAHHAGVAGGAAPVGPEAGLVLVPVVRRGAPVDGGAGPPARRLGVQAPGAVVV